MSVPMPASARPALAPRTSDRTSRRRLPVAAAAVLLIPSALITIGVVSASGTTHAVAVNGSDSNPGTEAAPWRTVTHAFAALLPGDTLLVHGGTYVEHVSGSLRAGSAGAPITVRAATGE